MKLLRQIASASLLIGVVLPLACSAPDETDETVRSESDELWIPGLPDPLSCLVAQPKDTLIAELMKDSWRVSYPLTRLSVGADGLITGPDLPPLLAGDLEVINTVPEARESVARALEGISGLPDYGMGGTALEIPSCLAVEAWTPSGTTTISTSFIQVFPDGTNLSSWRATHRSFGRECPLVRSLLNGDGVDPPGDGSTNAPPSRTVSASGVRANAYGLCPSGTMPGTFCKLSYAEGVNWTGRRCQYYYSTLRCLLY